MVQIQNTTQDKIWTKHFIIMIIVTFSISISMNMTNSTLPLYAQNIGGSTSSAGLIMGVFTLSALLFRPLFGNLLDSKGRKLVLITGIIMFSLVSSSYTFAYTVGILLILRFLHGIGFSAHSTASGTIVSDIIPAARIAEGIGYYGIANTIATAIGPALGLYLIGHSSYNILFVISFVLGVLGFISALFINYEHKGQKYADALPYIDRDRLVNAAAGNRKKAVIFEKTAIPTSAVLFFIALTYGSILTFLPSYAAFRGIKDIGIFFTVYALALLITRPITGKLADRYGFSTVILPGMALLFLSLVILAFAASLSAFLIAGVLYGLGYGSTQPTLNAIMVKLCPVERRGAANATFFSTMDIGIGLGAVMWGVVSQKAGFSCVYLASAVCVMLAFIGYVFTLRNQLIERNSIRISNITADSR